MKVFFAPQDEPGNGRKAWKMLGIAAVVGVMAGAGVVGFWYGQYAGGEQAKADATAAGLSAVLQQERMVLEETKRESMSHLDALGGRLGQMQAELLRLNALGGRLVQMAGLDEGEFDFQNTPPLGGPEPSETTDTNVAELAEEMDRLFSELRDRDRKLSLLEQVIMERDLEEEIRPSGSPVLSGFVTSTFGFRKDPINRKGSFHRGIDFAGKRGTPIVAVADGVVVLSETRSGFGRTVEVRHANGLVTRYAHNQKLLVKEGDLVKQGQTIATLGSSGRATGPHLHFEVLKDGEQVNPMKYVGAGRGESEG